MKFAQCLRCAYDCTGKCDDCIGANQFKSISVQHTPTAKPSNPKDVVGINKIGMSVVPMNVVMEAALGMTEGALKYGRHNYRNCGVRASVYYDALLRHIGAWWEGEDIDAASKLNHVTKAISCLMVLRDSMLRGNWVDDRPPKTEAGWMEPLNKRVEELRQLYPNTLVKHFMEKDNGTS